MATLIELTQQRDKELSNADNLVRGAQRGHRPLTDTETSMFNRSMKAAERLKGDIDRAKASQRSTATSADPSEVRRQLGIPSVVPLSTRQAQGEPLAPRFLSTAYQRDFFAAAIQGFKGAMTMTASLYEGLSSSGGYAVPVTVDQQIVPFAPTDSAVRRLATVIPTKMDIKIPAESALAAPSVTAETNAFPQSQPSFSQNILSAYLVPVNVQASLEILQDIPSFEAFVLGDVARALLPYEESLFITGTGSGEAQGLIGNVGAGVTEEPDASSNPVSVAGLRALWATLKSAYHPNATWLMSRATWIGVQAAQTINGVYEKVCHFENGRAWLLERPVEFSDSMPSAARGNAPVLFGDFQAGYIVGDRGGSAVQMKALDQMVGANGIVPLLCYRRTDGRVRQAEA